MKITVDLSGQGDFTTVQSAIDSIPDTCDTTVLIEIKKGVYREKISIPSSKPSIRLVGEGTDETVLVYSDNAHTLGDDGEPLGTFRSGSFYVYADDFSAEQLTIRNDSGPRTGQAVAAFIDADRISFQHVRFEGDQDTLYAAGGRHYFAECHIEGDVDFIFGPATAVFDRCTIHCKRTGGYLTAANTPEDEPFGYVFMDCTISGDPGVENVYLGRPWRAFANVVFLRSEMDQSVHPVGWHNWNQPEREETSRYAEFGSRGPGGDTSARVSWSRQLSEAEAEQYTIETVLGGTDGWHPLYANGAPVKAAKD
ncbi:pectinesterase family protein [Paenibacillus lemnae]|uniref:Pectinesterase n=1 Tax=Paenibacillus lemnae TaxID=1330551 RepID=A0A848M124_PAELE|nr:pectinesterase family protein [Paenibacillus lemnae]NMO94628.1 pectin esterase [Paenibacillus lemnae]